jgi:transposase InsO family protein
MIAQGHSAHPELSVRHLCRLAGVGRSWYYAHPTAAQVTARDVALRAAIERVVLDFPGYGYRRVTHALARDGWAVNHKRVLRVMRQESLLCELRRRFVPTTDSTHGARRYPNLLAPLRLVRPNQAWVADITYIRLPTAFVYLAAILDAFSRRCLGWKLSRTLDTDVALAALEQALAARAPAPGLIHHSDQGVQYASAAYVARLEMAGARSSMAAVGNPYENAKAERFFRTLKHEEVYLNDYQSFAEAEANIGRFIGDVYNTRRLHSALGYQPPVDFEAAIRASAAGP